jgi:hypothetical protein
MHDILTVHPSLSPIVITSTECVHTLVTCIRELLAKPRPLIAHVTGQISPIFQYKLVIGNSILPKFVNSLTTNGAHICHGF